MVSAPCKYLVLGKILDNKEYNGHENIITDISKTNFLQLKHLNLSNIMIKIVQNQISSIEQLQFVNMPVLEWLYLCKTSISQGKIKSQKLALWTSVHGVLWSTLTYVNFDLQSGSNPIL
jgi:hypothetical protein